MEMIAQGRDARVYAVDEGRVLRRYAGPRQTEREALIMAYVAEQGYPVPKVHETTDTDMVMDRISGPTMLDLLARRPWKAAAFGRLLGSLHDRLHAIPAPAWLPRRIDPRTPGVLGTGAAPGAAPVERGATARVLHLDLHPGNVIMSPGGPVVIDWSNASAGDPAIDLAMTIVHVGNADAPNRARQLGRSWFLRGVMKGSQTDYRHRISDVAESRLSDPNMTASELVRLRKLVVAAAPTPVAEPVA
jgi:aminoglycoside phosphotransferase (APT) family kinase protein